MKWLQNRLKKQVIEADPEEGPGGPVPPLFLDQNEARRAEEECFWDRSPHLPSIASTRERTRSKHVFTWRQTFEFQASNFEVFPPKCEVPSVESVFSWFTRAVHSVLLTVHCQRGQEIREKSAKIFSLKWRVEKVSRTSSENWMKI